MRSRTSQAAKAVAARAVALALSLATAIVTDADISSAFAMPRHPCASGAHDRLVAPVFGEPIARFGFRRDPVTGTVAWHAGIDYLVEPGASLRAAGLGRVSKVGGSDPDAVFITVNYGRGIEVTYARLGRTDLSVGRCIRRGDVLGEAGRQNSFRVSQRVHVEIRRNGVPIDPSQILQPYKSPLRPPT